MAGEVLSRRNFLKIAAGVGAGAALGVPLSIFAKNEAGLGWTIPEDVLLRQIKKNGNRLYRLGLHPDFESLQGHPWRDVDEMSRVLQRPVDYIGAFANLQDFQYPGKPEMQKRTLDRLAQIQYHDGTVVITMGVDGFDNGLHPLHPDNFPEMERQTKEAAIALNQIKGSIIIRWLIEMNNPHSPTLGHGKGGGLPDALHEEGYIRSFIMASQMFKDYRQDQTLFAFCPYVEMKSIFGTTMNPFIQYLPKKDKKLYADIVGLNGFSLYPGRGQVTRSKYWTFQNQTPEEIFIPSLQRFDQIVDKNVPRTIFEYGDYTHDPGRLRHTLFVCVAHGVKNFMHLNYDKSYLKVDYETRWNMTPEEMSTYKEVNDLVGANGSLFKV